MPAADPFADPEAPVTPSITVSHADASQMPRYVLESIGIVFSTDYLMSSARSYQPQASQESTTESYGTVVMPLPDIHDVIPSR